MNLVKIKTITSVINYVNADSIAFFKYEKQPNNTYIQLNTGTVMYADGDISAQLAKAIVSATNGSLVNV